MSTQSFRINKTILDNLFDSDSARSPELDEISAKLDRLLKHAQRAEERAIAAELQVPIAVAKGAVLL